MKNNKGITLVALVVTIVVLLILAGVSINLVLGNNGIIARAKDAKTKSAEASENDLKGMNSLIEQMESALNGNGGGSDTKVPAEPTAETAPYFPDNTFTKKEGTIDTGLVIQDASGNEYVWVVVPKSLYNNTNYNSNNDKKPSSSTDYEKIEYCLQQYTATYRNGTDFSDTYVEDSTTGWFKNADEYTAAKQKMLKSVYENGGFYVGRYEAGISENRTASGDATETPVSKANAYPYNNVTRTQAKVLAEKIKYTNGDKSYTGSLMFGVQWDLVLSFMSKDTTKVNQENLKELISDSTTIGNYKDNLWTIKNANAQYSTNSKQYTVCPNPYKKESASGILLTTGADSSFLVQNIYDIAGNVSEWTLENTSDTTNPCAFRGGNYGYTGSDDPAAGRTSFSAVGSAYFGFRVSLF